jgi:amino acid adenylation domain-containing protein
MMITSEFQKSVEAFPEKVSIKAKNRTVTYSELNSCANQVANTIMAGDREGIDHSRNQRVALLFEHGVDMIIGVMGVLKAGKTYVPLDITYPPKRLSYMLEDSESRLILTNDSNLQTANQLNAQARSKIGILNINTIVDEDARDTVPNTGTRDEAWLEEDGDRPAYILYTSGSTGQPKGVVQTHRNVLYYTGNWIQRFSITSSDRLTLLSAFSHDGAVQDIFAALLAGATLYPYNIRTAQTTNELYTLLMKEKITIWHSVPSLYRFFANTLTEKNYFNDIRWVLLGGEPLRKYDLVLFRTHFPKADMANVYGQTESSVSAICTVSREDMYDSVTLGKPLDETKILLIGKRGEVVGTIGVGEIVVACDYIAPEYWKDKEKSEMVFTEDEEFGRLYWTGDLGRLTADGTVRLVGRKDHQVKIRGFRVETGEIETALLQYPAVKETVVLAKEDENEDNYLCAYITANETIPSSRLREYLSDELPDYMVPRYFIPLREMPVTPNGKIDRARLPEPEEAITPELEYEPPTNEIQEKLVAIWHEVLNVEKVSINDNFVELGGHSLLLISILSKIHQVFNVELQLADVFDNPTVKELSRLIPATKETVFSSIEPTEEKEYYDTTPDQERMLILDRFEDIGITYNLTTALKIEGKFHRQRLENAFRKLIERHEAFRTSFEMIEDKMVQVIHKNVDLQIEYIDTEPLNPVDKGEIKKIVKDFIRPFDLSKALLLRVSLVKISGNQHLLLVDNHHIISDGTSGVILVYEFSRLYAGEELPGLTLRYRDYSEWQNKLSSSSQMEQQEEYWLNSFKTEIPVLDLSTDYPRPAVQEFAGDIIIFPLTKEMTQGLHQLVTETGTTLFIVLLTMYNVLLHKYTGQEDIVIGSIVSGRDHMELENVVGLFVKTLALRNYPAAGKVFSTFLQEVKDNALKALENQHYPFSRLVEKLNLKKDSSRNPLFDASFILQNSGVLFTGREEKEIGLKSTLIVHGNTSVKFDLAFGAIEIEDRMILTLQYRTKLFKRETIELMKERLLVLIESAVNNRDAEIRELDYSVPIEKEKSNLQEVEFDL